MGQMHLSTLVQQALSVIAQHGGVRAQDLYGALCRSGPFKEIQQSAFGELLHGLADKEIVTQVSDGSLTLGVVGEKLVDHYQFYAAFVSPEEYRLVAGSKTLGSVPIAHPLAVGDHLIFAGRRWEIVVVDDSSHVIELRAAKGGRAPNFEGGGFDIHDRVRREMFRLYSSEAVPVYLDQRAKEFLSEGRRSFARLELADKKIIEAGADVHIFPWRGDRVLHTLKMQLLAHEITAWVEGGE